MALDFLSDAALALRSADVAANYRNAEGFPHLIVDNFLRPGQAESALQAFPAIDAASWINYVHYNEKKYGLNKREALPAAIGRLIDGLNSPEFTEYLSDITGIRDLIADPMLEGGGLHQIPRGGFLNIHADFTAHPHHRNWRRRINLLIYLNQGWQDDYGGCLELWTRDMTRRFRSIGPMFNRCVIFNTDADSFHGHPDPLQCPPGVTRKSLALYYFTAETQPLQRATNYRARPGEGFGKRALVFLDKKALATYNTVKKLTGINDDAVSKVLRFLSKSR